MIVVLIVSLVAMILTFLDSRKILDGGMAWSFVLLTVLAAIHYEFGNDYKDYMLLYQSHMSPGVNLKLIFSGNVYKDYGWAFLEYIFKDIGGFFTLVAVLSVVQNIIYFRFIKEYVMRPWWPLSIFIYLFVTNYYLINMSMLRQGFTVALGILAFMLSVKGQDKRGFKRVMLILLSLLVAIFAVNIHKTAYAIFMILIFSFIPFRRGIFLMLILLVVFAVMMLNADFLDNVFGLLTLVEDVDDFAKTYEAEESAGSLGFGFVMNMVPNLICILYMLFCSEREYNKRRKQVVAIFSLNLAILPLAFLIQLSGRFGWYFTCFSLLAMPYAYSWVKNDYLRAGLVSLFVVMTVYDYYNFFRDPVYADAFSNFHTVFDVIF